MSETRRQAIKRHLSAGLIQARHYRALAALKLRCRRPISTGSIPAGFERAELRRQLMRAAGEKLGYCELDLAAPAWLGRFQAFYHAYEALYRIGQGKGKALEHFLGMELLDFSRAARYCDLASAASPFQRIAPAEFPALECWRQDLEYATDLPRRTLGGSAARLTAVPDGYFDALTLHNSFEHFEGVADSELIPEVHRILSPLGACLILPLYMAPADRIYFDPRRVTASLLESFDAGAECIAVSNFGQRHARFYSPQTVRSRLLAVLPPGLRATVIEFSGGETAAPMYPQFGLLLDRPGSIARLPVHAQERRADAARRSKMS